MYATFWGGVNSVRESPLVTHKWAPTRLSVLLQQTKFAGARNTIFRVNSKRLMGPEQQLFERVLFSMVERTPDGKSACLRYCTPRYKSSQERIVGAG